MAPWPITPSAAAPPHPASPSPAPASPRTELAALQRDLFAARTAVVRTSTNLNQAVAALNATGEAPIWLDHAVHRCQRSLDHLDALAADIDRRLR